MGLDPGDAGLRRPDPVFGLRADGAGSRHHLRPDGRYQHGARRVHDPRRLHDLSVLAPVPDLSARPLSRLLLRRYGGRLYRVGRARPCGRVAADTPSLRSAARYPARDLGTEPHHAAGVPLDLRSARGRRRTAAVDDGRASGHGIDRGPDQRAVRDGAHVRHHRGRCDLDVPLALGAASAGRGREPYHERGRRHRYAAHRHADVRARLRHRRCRRLRRSR